MARFFGNNLPFLSGGPGSMTVFPRQEDMRLIRNDLLQLLLTSPGERVMRPDFGSPIRSFLFEQMDNSGKRALERGIRRAVEQFERRVRLTDVQIGFTDDNRVDIRLFGYFSLDRFGLTEDIGSLAQADLLVELNIVTSQRNELR